MLCQLSYEAIWRFRRDLNPRSLAWQASVITTTPRNQLVAEDGFEPTTFGLWAQRATRLLYSAILKHLYIIWRRKRDSNPCANFLTSRFSRPVPSTRLGYSSIYFISWCPRSDLNRYELLHSQDFKSCASTYSATEAHKLVSRWGFEPQTPWLKVKCSTGWASETLWYNNFWLPRLDSNQRNARVKVLCLTTWLRGKITSGGERWIRTTEPEGTDLQSAAFSLFAISPSGAENRNRTRNLLITSQLLYQLSYFGKLWWAMRDSNSRPPACKADALTNWANRP